ncbi:HpcH/HpaI aldolase/citrate lyase family protein [Phaeacidiphilus oryzae]|uniref:HpcH/HpaI aldolase/citrate lyase family protein n=1 Tax=Phaeacidiphilus oryzae TaxID=348818 RepID=UPI000562F6F9|nr:CoA ester lyase [Phaeacidiphilus oryzae]
MNGESAPVRSWLYVPATRPDMLAKAMAGEADAVVLDLEDAVPAARKEEARRFAARAVRGEWPKPLWVRINPVRSPVGTADLEALAGLSPDGLRLPKCEAPDEVAAVRRYVEAPLHVLIESALGVEEAFRLALADPAVRLLSLGEADLRADLRVRSSAGLDWARDRIVNAARAAGLDSPVHSVWTDVADTEGLAADTEAARDRGLYGRSVVHPRQIATVNRVFSPRGEEVAQAHRLIRSLHTADGEGTGAWLDERGRLVDPAVVAQARWVLAQTSG